MEDLRALAWGFDALGLPFTDVSTHLTTPLPTGGGNGSTRPPAGALTTDTAGYVDYLDIHGAWIDPANQDQAAYVRSWSITRFPPTPTNTLIFRCGSSRARRWRALRRGQGDGRDDHLQRQDAEAP